MSEPVSGWYYLNERKGREGPISLQQMGSLSHEGELGWDDYVWQGDSPAPTAIQVVDQLFPSDGHGNLMSGSILQSRNALAVLHSSWMVWEAMRLSFDDEIEFFVTTARDADSIHNWANRFLDRLAIARELRALAHRLRPELATIAYDDPFEECEDRLADLGNSLAKDGALKEAETVFTAYIARVSAYDFSFFWRGMVRLEMRNYVEAARDFHRSHTDGANGMWDKDGFFSSIYREIEHTWQVSGKEALVLIRNEMNAVLREDPTNLIARVIRTNVADQGSDETTVEDLRAVCARDESLMPCCMLRQSLSQDESEQRRAAEIYTRAILLEPDFAALYHERGTLYEQLGEEELATQDQETAARLRTMK